METCIRALCMSTSGTTSCVYAIVKSKQSKREKRKEKGQKRTRLESEINLLVSLRKSIVCFLQKIYYHLGP